MRFALTTAAAAIAVLGFAGSTGAATTVPRCHTSQLDLRRNFDQGAAGTQYTGFLLANSSRRRCRLFGYPGVSFRDAHGRSLTRRTRHSTRGGTSHAQRVTLKPGAVASFVVSAPNAGRNGRPCRAGGRIRAVRVYPPDERDSLTLKLRHGPGCPGVLDVTAVQAGRGKH